MSQDKNLKSALCYAGGWITGLIFLLMEKEDQDIRFHAMQSLITFGGLNILMFVPLLNILLIPIVSVVSFVLWLVLMIKAYQGEKFKLPVIGDLAENQLKKMK